MNSNEFVLTSPNRRENMTVARTKTEWELRELEVEEEDTVMSSRNENRRGLMF